VAFGAHRQLFGSPNMGSSPHIMTIAKALALAYQADWRVHCPVTRSAQDHRIG